MIEQGLIPVFRGFLWVRFGLLVVTGCAWVASAEARALRFPLLGLVEVSLLLVYLYWERLQTWRYYLPVALAVAALAPIVENAVVTVIRVVNGLPAGRVYEDRWLLIFALFIPLLIIAWQYRFRAVAAFCTITALVETIPLMTVGALGGPFVEDVLWLIVIRSLMFLLFGYIVVRLMQAQRDQRQQLAAANAQLQTANNQIARFAATLEQLAISQERNRMARELHDTLAHSLSAVAVQLEAVRAVWADDPQAAQTMLDQALGVTRRGLTDARRAIHDLRASPLDDLGLPLAIRTRAVAVADRMGVRVTVDVQEVDLPDRMEQGIYRIADEALSNIARHAHGTQHIEVRMQQHDDGLYLLIRDDGPGFDTAATLPNGHFGLKGLKERAVMLGGELTIESQPGQGAAIRLTVEV